VGALPSSVLIASQPAQASHTVITIDTNGVNFGDNDYVAISGNVLGGEEDEPVTLSISIPGAHTEEYDAKLNRYGNYSFVYRVSERPVQGLYKFHLTFENKVAYSYFKVEYNRDITVNIDGDYAPGKTTPLEPDVNEYKFYAPGIGLIQDGELKLEEHGFKK
jgi:hypothetical protein